MKMINAIKRAGRYILHGVPQMVHTEARIVTLPPTKLLDGRNALIVGGTRGIGFAIAKAFLNAGAANVIITGRCNERNEAACQALCEGEANSGRVHSLVFDYSAADTFTSIPAQCEEILRGQRIDILVNNGAIYGAHFRDADIELWDAVLDTNLRGVYFLARSFGLYMKEHQIPGNILNITSASGLYPASAPYHVSKWGLRGITPGLAKIFAPYGIVVNALAPGPTASEMIHVGRDNIASPTLPSKRFTLPEELAFLAVVLVSSAGRCVIGDCLNATGGCGTITLDDRNHAKAYWL